MEKEYLYYMAFTFCLCLGSCKSSQHVASQYNNTIVSAEDFKLSENSIYKDQKAVIISKIVDVREKDLPTTAPWNNLSPMSHEIDEAWETTIEEKILLLKDNINNESYATIDYLYPRNMRWDLMKQCRIWLFSQDKNGTIHKREVQKKEMIRKRVNDSICRIQLNIKESTSGKILVQKYTLISPCYIGKPKYPYNMPAKIEPCIFQKEVPLLYGKYEICLPDEGPDGLYFEDKVYKLGKGEMNMKNERIKVTDTFYTDDVERNANETQFRKIRKPVFYSYRAEVITITVSDIMPLPEGDSTQPFGIQIIRQLKNF